MPSENGVMRERLGGREFTLCDLAPDVCKLTVINKEMAEGDDFCTAQWLASKGVDILFTAKLGEHARKIFNAHKIQIVEAKPGMRLEDLVRSVY